MSGPGQAICVIGASHVVALAHAHARAADAPPVRFMARTGGRFQRIRAEPNGIVARLAPGEPDDTGPLWQPNGVVIGYGEHEAFVVYGTVRLDGMLCAAHGLVAPSRFPRDYCEAVLAQMFQANPSLPLAKAIARRSGKPTFLLAAPFYAEAPDWADAAAPEALAFLNKRAAEDCAAAGVRFIPQPSATIAGGSHTKPAFARGLHELGNLAKLEGDRTHMNPAFGARVLTAIVSAVGERQPV